MGEHKAWSEERNERRTTTSAKSQVVFKHSAQNWLGFKYMYAHIHTRNVFNLFLFFISIIYISIYIYMNSVSSVDWIMLSCMIMWRVPLGLVDFVYDFIWLLGVVNKGCCSLCFVFDVDVALKKKVASVIAVYTVNKYNKIDSSQEQTTENPVR